jgi:hypothetical protein
MTGIYHIHAGNEFQRATVAEDLFTITVSNHIDDYRKKTSFILHFAWRCGIVEEFEFTDREERDLIFNYALNAWREAKLGAVACLAIPDGIFTHQYLQRGSARE